MKLKCYFFAALQLWSLFACTPDLRHVPLILHKLDPKVGYKGTEGYFDTWIIAS